MRKSSGDDGLTFISNSNERVSKSEFIFELLGSIDELNSWIGKLIEEYPEKGESKIKYQKVLEDCQNILFDIGVFISGNTIVFPNIEKRFEKMLKCIDAMNEKLPLLKNFILPIYPADVHIVRNVCRRVERNIVKYNLNVNSSISCVSYVNRLSKFLFVFARYVHLDYPYEEKIWKSNDE